MRRRFPTALIGFLMIFAGLGFMGIQSYSWDHFHHRWRSFGFGELTAMTNDITVGVIVLGAILVIWSAINTIKHPD